MKRKARQRKGASQYIKVEDARKQPIRGLWRRGQKFYARLTVEDGLGKKSVQWLPLAARTVAESQAELRHKLVERAENRLEHVGRAPKLADYLPGFLERNALSGKRPRTVEKDHSCLRRWAKALGHLRLDRIRPHHVSAFEASLRKEDLSGRTVNLYRISLRGLLKSARVDGYLTALPTDNLPWHRFDIRKRELVTHAQLERLCACAMTASKNGQQLADYLRFMAYSGARRNEALTLRWPDVDFERGQLTIGAAGDTKARRPRHVDFNPALEAHLRDMHARRAPDSQWLFPSPQRGEKDTPAKTFMDSLRLARKAAGMPGFGFHDCRHYFTSFAVMAGIDFATIAAWLGHRDGGVLIGKVYGHLAAEHTRQQARRLAFGPAIVELPKERIA